MTLPCAIYYDRLPVRYKDHVEHVIPFSAEIFSSRNFSDSFIRTAGQPALSHMIAESGKPKLEQRVRDIVYEYDVDLVLLEKLDIIITDSESILLDRVPHSRITYRVFANGSAFKTKGIDIPFAE